MWASRNRARSPNAHALYSVFVHRLALLLHASFRPRLATTPLRFANPSPPSGWVEDFHLQAVKHARHTGMAQSKALLWSFYICNEGPCPPLKARRTDWILQPSPPWGRGWLATGAFISRGETGEGVKIVPLDTNIANRIHNDANPLTHRPAVPPLPQGGEGKCRNSREGRG